MEYVIEYPKAEYDRYSALLVVVFCEKAALSKPPVTTVPNVEAGEIAMPAELADPCIVNLAERLPADETTLVASQFKAGPKKFMS